MRLACNVWSALLFWGNKNYVFIAWDYVLWLVCPSWNGLAGSVFCVCKFAAAIETDLCLLIFPSDIFGANLLASVSAGFRWSVLCFERDSLLSSRDCDSLSSLCTGRPTRSENSDTPFPWSSFCLRYDRSHLLSIPASPLRPSLSSRLQELHVAFQWAFL